HRPQRVERGDDPLPRRGRAARAVGRDWRQALNDDFLSQLREEPRPEFAEGLGRRLRAIEDERAAAPRPLRGRARPFLAAAAAVALVAAIVGLPPVRAAARGFLDLFRVKRFAAVPVDPERIARLQEGRLDLRALVGDQVETLEPAVEPEVVAGPDAAGLLARVTPRLPATLPPDAALLRTPLRPPRALPVAPAAAQLPELPP